MGSSTMLINLITYKDLKLEIEEYDLMIKNMIDHRKLIVIIFDK